MGVGQWWTTAPLQDKLLPISHTPDILTGV